MAKRGKKNLPANAGDTGDKGLVPESGGSPGGRNGNPLQYSCLENPMDRGGWRATVHRVAKSRTWLSDWARTNQGRGGKWTARLVSCRGKAETENTRSWESRGALCELCLSVPASVSFDCMMSEVSPWTEATGQDVNVGNTGALCGSS